MTSVFEQAQRYTEIWTDFASKVATAGMPYDPDSTPPEAAQRMRQATFQAVSQFAEEFMRSPQFLELSRQSMDAAIAFRQQMNDALTAMHHNMQGIARQDIDSMQLSVRHLEQRILDRMDDLLSRLDALDRRLAALEGGGRGAARPATRKRQVRHSNEPKLTRGSGASDGKPERLRDDVESLDATDGGRGDQQPATDGPGAFPVAEGPAREEGR